MKYGLVLVAVLGAFFFTEVQAINIRSGRYQNVNSFLDSLSGNKKAAFEKLKKATVFFPKRGTGVVVREDGLVLTAGHVIEHVAIGTTKKCEKLIMYIGHVEGESEMKLECEKVIHYSFNKDFALIKVKTDKPLVSIPVKKVHNDSTLGEQVIIFGHPRARSWHDSHMVATTGPMIFSEFANQEISHFLHWVDTEGGHSGSPVVNQDGELLGIHFRGVPHYGPGVTASVDGREQKVHKFNVAFYPHEVLEELGVDLW